ncbi:ABC transporter substrate-binding protein [Endozoicomonas sp. 8E]|uniref:MlaC/ttg2D family ABC transporter substrate-binding protein n=1 Tax=Endozoicomonas sp. 8E TaxID=3035692 RepID=UPI0029392EB1|nr:ABC transporter substrate-binding protein [Endozoicomonas sp. 8E]WOG29183.1 ABC transporter substrate-binding protein [Endozoicomonas sp. 8E]
MMKMVKSVQQFTMALVCLMVVGVSYAAPVLQPPEMEVRKITSELLDTFNNNKKQYQKDPEGFFKEVDRLLSPVVAFDQIARYVMGKYAHRSPEQVEKFESVFKGSLIRFYGKALLSLDDTSLVIESVDKTSPELLKKYQEGQTSRIPVRMKVRTSTNTVEIFYSMVHVDGRWKLRNVTIEGINIAKQFQSQFADAMKKHKKVSYVIDNWAAIMSASADGSSKK